MQTGATPLHLASCYGHAPVVELLLQQRDVNVNVSGCLHTCRVFYICIGLLPLLSGLRATNSIPLVLSCLHAQQ